MNFVRIGLLILLMFGLTVAASNLALGWQDSSNEATGKDPQPTTEFPLDQVTTRQRFSPDSRTIAIWDAEGRRPGDGAKISMIKLYDVVTGKQLLTVHDRWTDLTFSPDSKSFIYWNDFKLFVIDIATKEKSALITHELSYVYSVGFVAEGKRMVVSIHEKPEFEFGSTTSCLLSFWETGSWNRLETAVDDIGEVINPIVTRDGKTLAALVMTPTEMEFVHKRVLTVWDIETGVKTTIPARDMERFGITLDEKSLICNSIDGSFLWNLNDATSKKLPEDSRLLEIIIFQYLDPTSYLSETIQKMIKDRAVQYKDQLLTRWDLNSGKQIDQLKIPADTDSEKSIAHSSMLDRNTLALQHLVPTKGELNFFDAKSHQLLSQATTRFPIENMVISNDGRLLVTLSYLDRTYGIDRARDLIVWDIASRTPTHVLTGHANNVNTIALSNNAKVLASGYQPSSTRFGFGEEDQQTRGGNLKLWNTETGKLIKSIYDDGPPVFSLAFSPDDKRIAVGTSIRRENQNVLTDVVRIFDVETGAVLREIEMPKPSPTNAKTPGKAISLMYLPDGKRLAVGGEHGFSTWDVSSGKMVHLCYEAAIGVADMALAADKKSLILAATNSDYTNKRAVMFDLETGALSPASGAKLPYQSRYLSFFVPDGTSVDDGSTSLDVNNQTNTLALAGYRYGFYAKSGLVRLWNCATGESTGSIKTDGEVRALAFTPDQKTLISGGSARWHTLVRVVDLEKLETVFSIPDMVNAEYCPQSQVFVARPGPDEFKLFSLTDGKQLAALKHQNGEYNPHFSPDGKWLVTTAKTSVKIWDVEKIKSAAKRE